MGELREPERSSHEGDASKSMLHVTCEHEGAFNLLDCCALFSVLVMVLVVVRHILVSLIGLTVTLRVFFTYAYCSQSHSLLTVTRLTLSCTHSTYDNLR